MLKTIVASVISLRLKDNQQMTLVGKALEPFSVDLAHSRFLYPGVFQYFKKFKDCSFVIKLCWVKKLRFWSSTQGIHYILEFKLVRKGKQFILLLK